MDTSQPRRRKFEQQTHSGTSSAATMGAGGTGQSGIRGGAEAGNSQSAGRTDDLLSGCVSEDQRADGFQRDCNADSLRQGLEQATTPSGGNRQ